MPVIEFACPFCFEKQVRERLQEIIEKYPDTPSAKQAQRQVEKMRQ